MTYRTTSGGLYVGLSPPSGSTPLGILYPRAGTLGGCGSHNAMITIYPHKSDWSFIRTLTGDDSWAPNAMREYFKRMENAEYLPNGIVGHGFNGWLTTSVTSLTLVLADFKLLSLVISAATAMGKSTIGFVISTITGLGDVLLRDINADTPDRDSAEGLYQVPIAVDDGKRNGPREFILSVANAKNSDGTRRYHLDLQLNTLVTKLRFSTTTNSKPRAMGVDFLVGKSLYRADPRSGSATSGVPGSINASREVIISAGAFNTPQLLKLSGIGPSAELDRFNIPVMVDLPGVGTNMQDRYETSVIGRTELSFTVSKDCTFLRTSPDPCYETWEKGVNAVDRGIYASNGIALAVKKSTVADGDPDVLITGAPANFPGYYPGYSVNGTLDAKHWSWITLKAHSRNRAGTVTLASADPRDMPIINFNSFDSTDGAKDLRAVVEGMKLSRKMFQFVNPVAGSFDEVWPGPWVTDDSLDEFIRNEAWGHHASCTCPIGPDSDPMAVLDSKFRVRGIEGLRVVDASIFPKIPGFYIAAPIYMISEKAADMIINDAKS
jgi:choline dehydrogenase